VVGTPSEVKARSGALQDVSPDVGSQIGNTRAYEELGNSADRLQMIRANISRFFFESFQDKIPQTFLHCDPLVLLLRNDRNMAQHGTVDTSPKSILQQSK